MRPNANHAVALWISAVFAGAVWAQQTTATFYAVVTDSSGAMIPEATVTLTHEGTGAAATKKDQRARGSCIRFPARG